MYLFQRSKTVSVKQVGENLWVQGVFIDTAHEIVVELQVGLIDSTINKVEANFVRVPHQLCVEVEKKIQGLLGVSINKGISKIIKEKTGGPQGCYHLYDLLLEAIRGIKQAHHQLTVRNKSKAEREHDFWQELQDTCYYYTHGKKP